MNRIIFKRYGHPQSSNPYDYLVVNTGTHTYYESRYMGVYGGAIELKTKKDYQRLIEELKANGFQNEEDWNN